MTGRIKIIRKKRRSSRAGGSRKHLYFMNVGAMFKVLRQMKSIPPCRLELKTRLCSKCAIAGRWRKSD